MGNMPSHSQHIATCSFSQQLGEEDVGAASLICPSFSLLLSQCDLLLAPRDPISCTISCALVIPVTCAHGQIEKTLSSFVLLECPREIVLAPDALFQALREPERDAACQIWRLRVRGRRGSGIAPVRLLHVNLAADAILVRVAQFVERLGQAVSCRYFKARERQLFVRVGLQTIIVIPSRVELST